MIGVQRPNGSVAGTIGHLFSQAEMVEKRGAPGKSVGSIRKTCSRARRSGSRTCKGSPDTGRFLTASGM